jgi:hypothetical protein
MHKGEKPIWKNLLRYLCPLCDEPLEQVGDLQLCSNKSCEFRVGVGRFNWLVKGMQNPKKQEIDDPDKNLRDLNNL